ncbi:MAG: hypothetical protein HC847_11610 [Hydrococcus sp. RU_2_2]|nr:hypothetical protein [Hydrococcus sp. RU_2_2]NJP18709.1 hypothetical protein [Hydrococcus sp. CRU_1_1]
MSSGHASHKSTSAKPNVNANGQIDVDVPPDENIESGAPIPGRTKEIQENPAATERVENQPEEA